MPFIYSGNKTSLLLQFSTLTWLSTSLGSRPTIWARGKNVQYTKTQKTKNSDLFVGGSKKKKC